ncbi:hypothetical protein D1007_06156 [Hordeum vulgare]|nr:hypothetical protein D1007_06156 [Hordeum vulgare]
MPAKKKYTFPHLDTAASSQAKPRKPMARPVGVSDAEWRAYIQRREAVTANQRRRIDTKRIRDATTTVAVDQEEASRAGMMNLPSRNPQSHGGADRALRR